MLSERALIDRINRRLAPQGLRLRKMRPPIDHMYGEFVLVDIGTNTIYATDQDLAELAKTEGAFSPRELLLGKNEGWQ